VFSSYNHVIFDLDGTIIDSAYSLKFFIDKLRIEKGLEPYPIENYRKYSSEGGEVLISKSLNIDDKDEVNFYLAKFREIYLENPIKGASIYPFIKELLNNLKERGVFVSLCTNKPNLLMLEVLKRTKLINFFDELISATEFGYKKPHKQSIEKIILTSKITKEETVLIGDSEIDYLASFNAGIDFILFSSDYDTNFQSKYKGPTITSFSELIQ